MIRTTLLASILATLVLGAASIAAPAQASENTTTVCMPFSPGFMQCTEYGDNFQIIRQYVIRDDSEFGYIF